MPDTLKNGNMGINVQDIENNTPYSLSVFGDEQIYSGERLGNKVNLNIVFDHPTSDRNWKITGDGTFGIKKIDGIIHFDSSFGREAFVSRYLSNIFNYMSLRYNETGDFVDTGHPDAVYNYIDRSSYYLARRDLKTLATNPFYTSIVGTDAADFLLDLYENYPDPWVPPVEMEETIESVMEVYPEYKKHRDNMIDYNELVVKSVADFFDIQESEMPSGYEYSFDFGPILYNYHKKAFETYNLEYVRGEERRNNSLELWNRASSGSYPDDDQKMVALWIIHFFTDYNLQADRRTALVEDERFNSYIKDYNDLDRLIAKTGVRLHYSAARGTVNADRWYRLDYTISKSIGSAKVILAAMDKLVPYRWSGVYISDRDINLKTEVGDHHLYFKSSPILKAIDFQEKYYDNDGFWIFYPEFQLIIDSHSKNDIIEIKDFKLKELIGGDLNLSGMLLGGGERGVKIDNKGNVGIGLTFNDHYKHSDNVVNKVLYEHRHEQLPQVELHVRGQTGRSTHDPDNPIPIEDWMTPVQIEDIPPCSWLDPSGIRASKDIRGAVVVDDNGRFYINEDITCGPLAVEVEPHEIAFGGLSGFLSSSRRFSFVDLDDASAVSISSIESVPETLAGGTTFLRLKSEITDPSGPIEGTFVEIAGRRGEFMSGGISSSSSPSSSSSTFTFPGEFLIKLNNGLTGLSEALLIASNKKMIIGDVGNSATGRPERTLHIEPVEDEPPIRIGGGTIHAGNGKELVVDSSGDVSENWGAARIVSARVDPSLVSSISVGSPVVFHSWDSSDLTMVVTTNGSGGLTSSTAIHSSGSDTVVGTAMNSASADQNLLVQISGIDPITTRVFLPALTGLGTPPSVTDPNFVIPAGTPLVSITSTSFASQHSDTTEPPAVEQWLIPAISGSGSVSTIGSINTVGFLMEDIDLNVHLANAQTDSSGDGKGDGVFFSTATAGAEDSLKVFIRPG